MAGSPVIFDHTGKPYQFEAKPSSEQRYDGFDVPHVLTFAGIFQGAYRTYYHRLWDEAQRHSHEDALAMRRDAFLMSLMQERRLAVCSLKWHLAVDDEYDKRQLKVKDHLTKVVKSIPRLQQLIYYLLDAVWYGRYGSQLQWGWKKIDGRKSLCVQRHIPVNGDKIGHTLDHVPYVLIHGGADNEQLRGDPDIIQTTENRAIALRGSWRERFVIHQHEVDDADYLDPEGAEAVHGVGVRHRVFWLDWLRREYIGWLVDFLERVGLGVTIFYYDASNPNSKAEAERAASEQSRRSVILWPQYPDQPNKGGSVQRIETPTGGAAVLMQLQTHLEDVIQRYVVGQSLSSGTEGSGLGGSGVAALHAETKQKIVAWDANNLAETLTNDLVGVILRWTYPDVDFPVRWVFDVTEANPEGTLGAVSMAYQLGVAFKTQEVRALTGLSDPEPDDEVIVMPQDPAMMGGGQPPPGAGGEQPPPGGEDQMAAIEQAMGGGQKPDAAFDQMYQGQPGGGQAAPSPQVMMRRAGRVVRYNMGRLEGPLVGVQQHGKFVNNNADVPSMSPQYTPESLRHHAASTAALAMAHNKPRTMRQSVRMHGRMVAPDGHFGLFHVVMHASPDGRVAAQNRVQTNTPDEYGRPEELSPKSLHEVNPLYGSGLYLNPPSTMMGDSPPPLHAQVHIHPDPHFREMLKSAVLGGPAEAGIFADYIEERGRPDLADRIRTGATIHHHGPAVAGAIAEPHTEGVPQHG